MVSISLLALTSKLEKKTKSKTRRTTYELLLLHMDSLAVTQWATCKNCV